jgi:hypothetical protein
MESPINESNNEHSENVSDKTNIRKISNNLKPSNLKPVKRIFNREISKLYYDDEAKVFYSTNTKRRTRTFCPITWAQIKYNYTKQNRVSNKIYKYLRIPLGDGTFSGYQKWNGKIGRMLINQSEKFLLKNKFLYFFIYYEHGNVVCKILSNTDEFNKPITIPIFYTKFISTSVE